jgi:hypothetical protein
LSFRDSSIIDPTLGLALIHVAHLVCVSFIPSFFAPTHQLKKHDKFSQWSDSSAVLLPRIVRAPFFTSPILKMLLDQVCGRSGARA